MAQVINTNVSSLFAQRNLNNSQSTLNVALQRLSSGLRINSAKDDAAGLAISDRMTSQIRGLNQAVRNANDGISLAQTAEGALSEMSNNMQRLRELSVQAANAGLSASDRGALQTEASQLLQEIDRVAGTTQYNGVKLLDGSFSAQAFQVGADANQTISVSMNSARTGNLGTGDAAALTAKGSSSALSAGDLVINGVSIGASAAASDMSSYAGQSASAIAKVAAINAQSSATGVTATVDQNVAAGTSMTAAAGTGKLTINGVDTALISTTTDAATSRAAVVSAINAISGRTGVTAVDTGQDNSGVKLVAADGRNISIEQKYDSTNMTLTAANTGLTAFTNATSTASNLTTTYGSYTLSSNKAINIAEGTGTLTNAGLVAGTYASQTAFASSTSGTTTALASGDVKINGVLVGASLATYDTASSDGNAYSAIAKAAAVNAVSGQTGVTAKVNANTVSGSNMTAGTAGHSGTITINGFTTGTITLTGDTAKDRAATAAAINAISGQTGVTATDTNSDTDGVTLNAADGRNVKIVYTPVGTSSFGETQTGVGSQTTHAGTFTLSSAKSFTIEQGTTTTGTTNFGLGVGTYGSGKSGESLAKVDLSTVEGANRALAAIDNALGSVNTSRAQLGAVQNRFASTVSSLQTTSENLTAARSRIMDADFAAETAALTRGQILQQAGTAMLAQANSLPNNVLSLLRG